MSYNCVIVTKKNEQKSQHINKGNLSHCQARPSFLIGVDKDSGHKVDF